MKHLSKFNESWFSKKKVEDSDIIPKGMKSSTGRLSSDESDRLQKSLDKLRTKSGSKVDTTFLQEISDRLYGVDSEEYMKAIDELNKLTLPDGSLKFKPRVGRFGHQLFDPLESEEIRKREQDIIKGI